MTRLFFAAFLGVAACSDVASSSSAIVGGNVDTTTTGVVMVYITAQSSTDGWADCTGTVISPHVVITAAHCVDPALVGLPDPVYRIYVGNDVYANPAASDFYAVQATIADPAFIPQAIASKGHDVGVVVTTDPLPIAPMPFATALDASIIGQSARLVGYGETDPADSSSDGVRHSGTTTIAKLDDHQIITADQLPSGCEGDSGGPLFVTMNGKETLAGVISHGTASENCAGASYVERVDIENDFLAPIVAQYDPPPAEDAGPPTPPPAEGSCNASGRAGGFFPLVLALLFVKRRRHGR